ncbi:hypothetical protein FXW78_27465 [Rhodococcus opacus]|nr:hypothetical protein [Rhodococcus opacus]RZL84958.1 MAG: hypothetical protein EOP32_01540 [Rhodococcus sp. (in: high G+C Gram-positive bacteria)]
MELQLSEPVVEPGVAPTVAGVGCPPGSVVEMSVDGVPSGEVTADSAGTYSAMVASDVTDVGRYQVQADCGPVYTTPLDVVLVSQSTGATTTLLVIVFFLLIGLLIYRRRLLPVPSPGGDRR